MMPMHGTGAQCPVHEDGTTMGAMPSVASQEALRPRARLVVHDMGKAMVNLD